MVTPPRYLKTSDRYCWQHHSHLAQVLEGCKNSESSTMVATLMYLQYENVLRVTVWWYKLCIRRDERNTSDAMVIKPIINQNNGGHRNCWLNKR